MRASLVSASASPGRPAPRVSVDDTRMREKTDETELKQTIACAGGACELV